MSAAAAVPTALPTSGSAPAVSVAGLTKSYGRTTVLERIDLDVARGRFLVLLGPSGSGKSTLLRAIAGLERFDAGEIRIGGRTVADARRSSPPEVRDLAMVFQDYALWPHMTVRENVGFALRRRRLGRAEAQDRVRAALERVGLGDKGERFPDALSGGQQQRVALARALVAHPSLILFDEPLSNLDADLRERLRVEIATLTAELGATAVYITHDQAEAFALADEVAVLESGRIAQWDTPERIYRNPATPFVARFTGLAGRVEGVVERVIEGFVAVRVGDHVVNARRTGDLRPGTRAEVLLRPTALRVSDHADGGLATTLTGVVTDSAYRGAAYDYAVATPVGPLISIRSPRARAVGERVVIEIDADSAFAFAL